MIRTLLVGTLIVGGLAVPPAFAAKETVKTLRAQEKLQSMCYYTGEIHGRMTNETQEGIARFQYDQRLDINGKLNNATVERLGGETARISSSPDHFGNAGQDMKTGYGGGAKKMGQGVTNTGHEWGQGNVGQGFGAFGKGIGTGVADMGVGTGKAVWNSTKGIGASTQEAMGNVK